MENKPLKQKLLSAALSASAGLSGMAAISRCTGGGCSTCLGCAVPGIGVLLLAALNRFSQEKPAAN